MSKTYKKMFFCFLFFFVGCCCCYNHEGQSLCVAIVSLIMRTKSLCRYSFYSTIGNTFLFCFFIVSVITGDKVCVSL